MLTQFSKRKLSAFLFAFAMFSLAAAFGCSGPTTNTPQSENKPRIVSVGASNTEVIYALGAEADLVGTDTSSFYPEAATKLPQVGYQRALSAEGVISLKPTLVIVSAETGPPPVIKQIEDAGIKVVKIQDEKTVESAKEKIRQIASLVDKKDKGEEIIKALEADMADAEKFISENPAKSKVMFIYSRGTGAVQVGGLGTHADAMIKLAGAENAVTGFDQYKPLTPEAMVSSQPDVILVPSRGLESMGGIDAVLKLPGVADTPAGKNKKIIAMDDVMLLGFSPRLGKAVKELAEKIR